ncbi:unnamed protein product [Psylliodes chrysocephalus]|uniref:PPPDE domain-containing protein n=1 Tax=Psylliodes chrysocephalus TaxID=3402493 RepID=A0A9P0D071_9CUCU|nr:unnamed protein product [Psylliodes chrysocephala]
MNRKTRMASTKNPVLLYAYKLAKMLSSKEYAWHVSVYVFGYEISYGNGGINTKQIMEDEPNETKIMGYTDRTVKELYNFLKEISTEWTAQKYDVLRNNCQHFAEKVLKFLRVGKNVPRKYTELPTRIRRNWGSCVSVSSAIIKSFTKSSGSNSTNENVLSFGELIEKDEERERRTTLCERNKQIVFSNGKGLLQAPSEKKSSVIIEEISTVHNEFQESSNSNQIAVQRGTQHPNEYNNKMISSGRNNQITLTIQIDRYVLEGMFYLMLMTITIILFTKYVFTQWGNEMYSADYFVYDEM